MDYIAPISREHLVMDALHRPSSAIGYYISQQLALLNPDRFCLETSDSDFNIIVYATDGECELAVQTSIHPQHSAYWNGTLQEMDFSPTQVLYRVTWQGQSIDVLQVTWSDGGCTNVCRWIIAATEEVALAIFRAVCAWNSKVVDEIMVFQDGYWEKSAALFESIRLTTLESLILPKTLKEEIHADLVQFFNARALYADLGIPWKRGIILIGPPGNGKTHLVKGLINSLDKPCLYVKSVESGDETTSHNIRMIFEQARESAPCVLILEDLDSLITDQSRSFFLNEVDGFATNLGIVIVATTNYPERIDRAILNRPSRFDRKYYLDLPAAPERLRYIERWHLTLRADLHLTREGMGAVAEATEGFSFAYLKELFLSSMMRWMATPDMVRMDQVVLEQIATLREQMTSATAPE